MPKNYEEQSHQSLPNLVNYWSKLPTPNITYLDFLFETYEVKAIKEFEKIVDIIEKKKVKGSADVCKQTSMRHRG